MLAQNIAPKPASLLPAVQPSLPANTAGGPSFAQFLTEQAAAPAPPPPTDAEPSESASAADAAPAPAAPTRRAPVAAKPASPARTPDGAAKAEPKADAKAAADAGKSEAIAARDEESPDTPELKEFTQLIGMNTPAASAPDAAAAVAADGQRAARRGRADATADDAATGRPAGRSPLDAAAGATDAGQTPQAKAADRQASQAAQADERAARSDTLQAMSSATQATQDAPPAAAQPTPGTPSFAAVMAQAMPALPAQADAATTTARAALHEPLHSAAFAPELGTRVSLLAVDGVQHAELQLNPADMGPVSVQIVVDGSQAQVSFHAMQAETRQALEQSLPDLAAALQGQGLTLAGGGVFQQASRDADPGREGANAGDGTRSAGGGNEPAAGSSAPVRRTVGLLDTFA